MHLPPDATPGGTSCHHTHWDPFSAEPCTAVHLRPTMSPPVRGWIPPDSPGGLGGRCLGGLGCDSLAQLTFPGLAPRSLLVQLQRCWLESTDPACRGNAEDPSRRATNTSQGCGHQSLRQPRPPSVALAPAPLPQAVTPPAHPNGPSAPLALFITPGRV